MSVTREEMLRWIDETETKTFMDSYDFDMRKAIRSIVESWPGAVKRGDVENYLSISEYRNLESRDAVFGFLGVIGIPVED